MKRRSVVVRAHWRSGAHIMCFQLLCFPLGTHPSPWFLALLLLLLLLLLWVFFLMLYSWYQINKIIQIKDEECCPVICSSLVLWHPYLHCASNHTPLSHIRVTVHYTLWHNKLLTVQQTKYATKQLYKQTRQTDVIVGSLVMKTKLKKLKINYSWSYCNDILIRWHPLIVL